jgi:flagellar hook-associated protein FlgK
VTSDFFGLSVGLSALNVARRQMEVAAQNVSNANNPGYSRQRVEIAAIGNPIVAGIATRTENTGGGVSVSGVFRTVDEFLQARSLVEHSTNASLQRSKALLDRVELTFNEPSETGLQAQLADFWAGWEDVANNPGDLASRSQLLQRGITLSTTINQAGADLENLWKSSVEQLQTVVTGVNATAKQIADLNGSIKRATAAGLSPNALLDQRDALALQLAEQIGGVVKSSTLGQVDIYVGGTAVVRGEDAETLYVDNVTGNPNIINALDNPATLAVDPAPVSIRWSKDNFAANVGGGEAGALLDGLNRMLPQYRAALLGPGVTPASAVEPGAGVTPASLTVNFDPTTTPVAGTPFTFQVQLDGGAVTNVTLDTNLSGPPDTTASEVQVALNEALGAAGLTDVVAKVQNVAGNLVIGFESVKAGAGHSVAVTGANGTLFTAAPTTTAGAGALPSLAAQLSQMVNARHQQGVDLNGVAGKDFFTFDVVNGLAMNISSPSEIAAGASGKPGLDAGNALSLADITNEVVGPDNTYRSLIIGLGVEAQTSNRRVDIQSDITKQVDAAKDSAAGVSIDDEMANMIAYQHTYGAASRVITAIDEMLDRLINHTGIVGR